MFTCDAEFNIFLKIFCNTDWLTVHTVHKNVLHCKNEHEDSSWTCPPRVLQWINLLKPSAKTKPCFSLCSHLPQQTACSVSLLSHSNPLKLSKLRKQMVLSVFSGVLFSVMSLLPCYSDLVWFMVSLTVRMSGFKKGLWMICHVVKEAERHLVAPIHRVCC